MSVFYVGVKWSPFFPVFKTSASEVNCNYCRKSLMLSTFWISCRQITLQVFRVPVELTRIRSSETNLTQIRSCAGCLFSCCCWCCCGYLLFLLLFQGNIQVPNRLILTPKGRGGGGGDESKCSVSEEQNFEKVTVSLDISAVKSLHSLWQQTRISKFTFLFEVYFFPKKNVKARILTFYGRVRNGDVTTQHS